MRTTTSDTGPAQPSAHTRVWSSAGIPAAERFSPAETSPVLVTCGAIEPDIEADVTRRARIVIRRDGIAAATPTVR
jgi:hypothetical protein